MNKTQPKLLIISDSPMWLKPEGVVVFEPTLREIEMLTQVFSEIMWIGFANPAIKDANARTDKTGKIRFHLLKLQGGSGFKKKLLQFIYLFNYIYIILKYIFRYKYIHTRAPSVPALIGILISRVDTSRKYWHKFAGNWMQVNAPRSYSFQKEQMLKSTKSITTVNGFWKNLPDYILPFENPCFTESELLYALNIARKKEYTGKLKLLFTGRIEDDKGVGRIIDALKLLPTDIHNQIESITFTGKGKPIVEEKFKKLATDLPIEYIFTGALSRERLEEQYAEAHLFLLPSTASEGFPKVIAEAAAFGCVPCVSDVSSVTFYIKNNVNGIVFSDVTPPNIALAIENLIRNRDLLTGLSVETPKLAQDYTYERYNRRIKEEVFHLD